MVLKEIEERYSTRSFSDKELSDEVIEEILKAGRLAPSWVNTQPWHFIVVKEERNKALLSQLAHGQPHVEKAQAVIICCADKDTWEEEVYRKTLEAKGLAEERIEMFLKSPALNPKLKGENAVVYRSIESSAYAMAYMTIQAKVCGVGACIVGALGNELTETVPEVYELAKKTFEIPDNIMLIALMPLGHPDESQPKPEKIRKPVNDAVSWGFFGNKK